MCYNPALVRDQLVYFMFFSYIVLIPLTQFPRHAQVTSTVLSWNVQSLFVI